MCIKTITYPSCGCQPSRTTRSNHIFPSQEARAPGIHTDECAATGSRRGCNYTREVINRSTEPCENCSYQQRAYTQGVRNNQNTSFQQGLPPHQAMSNMFAPIPDRPGGERLMFGGGNDYGSSANNYGGSTNPLFTPQPQYYQQQPQQPRYNNGPSVSGLFSTYRDPPQQNFFQTQVAPAPPSTVGNPFAFNSQLDAEFAAAMQFQAEQGESFQQPPQQDSSFSFSYHMPQ